jgi:flavodoxin I
MGKTIVVYGSSTGTCEAIAGKIAEKLGVEAINVSDLTADVIAENNNLLIGTSTWGAGELQDDWYDGIDTLKGADLSGKVVAVFGCGDSASYSDTFCGAMKELYDAAKAGGATVVGEVDIDGYTFDDSDAVVDNKFVGLALDDINEDDKTDGRIDAWLEQINGSLK